ncbi:MAG: DUF4367 domain-containing protein [Oscillospiraceae bacterium]|nr:DUF4367 domain-containing protein [Oscillospiraceae bacterium]
MSEEKSPSEYSNLNNLSTQALNDILSADFERVNGLSAEYVAEILAILEKRGELDGVDTESALERFHAVYVQPEGAGQPLYAERAASAEIEEKGDDKKKTAARALLRRAVLAAAVIAAAFGVMLTVQAAGYDIFGFIGNWTDETFSFAIQGEANAQDSEPELTQYLPTWVPEGFENAEVEITEVDLDDFRGVIYSYTAPDGGHLIVQVMRYSSAEYATDTVYFKDEVPAKLYESNGRDVYMFSNLENNTAACMDGLTEISASGSLTFEQLEKLFDSIGEI